jgi:DNA-directed RNA polymerase specialized sigma24 family protein
MALRNPITGSDADRRFEALFRDHHQAVLSYCRRRMVGADAEDLAADVFAVAWRRLDEVPHADAEKAWLLGVAYRSIATRSRPPRAGSRPRRPMFCSLPPWGGCAPPIRRS